MWRNGRCRYLATWPTAGLADLVLEQAAREAGLDPLALPEGLRLRRAGTRRYAFNHAATPASLPAAIAGEAVLGGRTLPPAGLCVLDEAPAGGPA